MTLFGGILLGAGIVMIPYPGPGWLTVFAALGLLSTEYDWAKRLLKYSRGKYDAWENWLSSQSPMVKASFWLMTAAVVVVTLWLLNAYGIINHFFALGLDWVDSPLPIFGAK